MAKNIVIFSDGTGQAGGINFDEARTNVYKLYRACRVGPDSPINPAEQVAFYDPGLGSAADGSQFKIGWMRWIYNLLSMATGLGITNNIIDCYAAIIRLYEDGDRIFLIGFSRGAYTVRSIAGVISYCGIPRHLPDNAPLQRDLKGSRTLAEHAVKDVYQFCSSYDRSKIGRYLTFMMQTRDAIAAKFRSDHGCSATKDGIEQANVFPYFIGVFDTVAALGSKWLGPIVVAAVLAIPFVLHYLGSALDPIFPAAGRVARDLGYFSVVLAILIYLKNYLKIAPSLPGYGVFKRLATLHLTRSKHKFYDTTLNVNVDYAKHAISIDEDRADFARVGWAPTAKKLNKRDDHDNLYFEQVWFPGIHADVGGGYIENEARLRAEGDELLFSVETVGVAPKLRAVRFNQQIQATAVAQFVRFFAWLTGAAHRICDGHGFDPRGSIYQQMFSPVPTLIPTNVLVVRGGTRRVADEKPVVIRDF